jgi:hypothetical protein
MGGQPRQLMPRRVRKIADRFSGAQFNTFQDQNLVPGK